MSDFEKPLEDSTLEMQWGAMKFDERRAAAQGFVESILHLTPQEQESQLVIQSMKYGVHSENFHNVASVMLFATKNKRVVNWETAEQVWSRGLDVSSLEKPIEEN